MKEEERGEPRRGACACVRVCAAAQMSVQYCAHINDHVSSNCTIARSNVGMHAQTRASSQSSEREKERRALEKRWRREERVLYSRFPWADALTSNLLAQFSAQPTSINPRLACTQMHSTTQGSSTAATSAYLVNMTSSSLFAFMCQKYPPSPVLSHYFLPFKSFPGMQFVLHSVLAGAALLHAAGATLQHGDEAVANDVEHRQHGSNGGLGPGAGPWVVGKPEEHGLSSALLAAAAKEAAARVPERYCILVVKDGVIVSESYFNNETSTGRYIPNLRARVQVESPSFVSCHFFFPLPTIRCKKAQEKKTPHFRCIYILRVYIYTSTILPCTACVCHIHGACRRHLLRARDCSI